MPINVKPSMTNQAIIQKIKDAPTSQVKIAVVDIDGVLRGKIIHRDKFLQSMDSSLGFCDVIFGWDSNDHAYDNGSVTGWHTGFPDAQFTLDMETYRTIPWQHDMPFFLGDFSKQGKGIQDVCPRTLLKKIAAECDALGFLPMFTQEFEWFNFEETPDSWQAKGYVNPRPMMPGMFGYSLMRPAYKSEYFNDLFNLLEKFGVPLEGLHTETGPGVYEACTHPASVVHAADQALLLKAGVKEIAYRHHVMASFMAKWSEKLPGCSGHVHQSLWSKDQSQNLFVDNNDPARMSVLMKHYIAGQLVCLPYILPFYAPTINSYKRLVEGAWAPTTVTWGIDNRTTALRVLNVSDKLTHLETRIPGADTNPYLAMAACLASGLYGIKNNLDLTIPQTKGNGYEVTTQGKLATNLWDATQLMKASDIPAQLFGAAFVDHFARTREFEWRQFSAHVTDWEMKQYFEII